MTSPHSDGSILFSSLPKWRTPWSEFALSYGAQAAVLALLVWIPVLHPEVLEAPKKDYHAIELVPEPLPVNHQPQHQFSRPALRARVDPPPAAMRLPAPQPKPKPNIEDAPTPHVKLAGRQLDPVPAGLPALPKQAITTNVFSSGSSASQTIQRLPQQVQTGGFGDPNGIPARTVQARAVNIARSGGFDLPTGPGSGNGTSGAQGLRVVVASSGFGDGVAIGKARGTSAGSVQAAGFGDMDVAAPPTVQSRPAPQAANLVPAEIISKPLPAYTAEARAQRIEGEVLLEVVLEASGKLRILRIVRGLGHGLDDAAVQAAEKIRFKPALRDGQPSDSTVVVHIVFQLA